MSAEQASKIAVKEVHRERAPLYFNGLWLGLALVVAGLDQYSKRLVIEHLDYGEHVGVLPFFSWVHWRNEGAAFSFLNDAGGWQRWVFVTLAIGVCSFLVFELMRLGRRERLQAWAFALILGGALGNLIDRIALGYVTDFLRFYWRDWYFPAFNVADSAIFLGVVLWFILIWRESREQP